MKFSMNANIMKMHTFHSFKYDLKGYGRSHKALLGKCFLDNLFINRLNFLFDY